MFSIKTRKCFLWVLLTLIKPRHCSELILSMVLIILSIQRCPFSRAFKVSTRAHLNLSTRTVLYRQVTNHWMTEIHIITFRLLYSKSENCHSGSYAADWRVNSVKVDGLQPKSPKKSSLVPCARKTSPSPLHSLTQGMISKYSFWEMWPGKLK